MKVIALYLPQYHSIKENDEWWGKDYTEWDSVKRGAVLMDGQYQPRIPLDNNYYNLLDEKIMKWQIDMAHENGIYGFCVYHYWFNGKLLLEKPMEQFLRNKELDIPFCFSWANEDWSNIWSGDLNNIKILISNKYNDKKDWYAHFYYMLPFFKDPRYMKEDNMPVFVLYNPLLIPHLDKMFDCWKKLAKINGFDGIKFIYQGANFFAMDDKRKKYFDYGFEYLPGLIEAQESDKAELKKKYIKHKIVGFLRNTISTSLLNRKIKENSSPNNKIKKVQDYDDVWQKAQDLEPKTDNIIPGAFTDWDNTPRRKYYGKVILGSTPEKFKHYMIKQIQRAKKVYNKDVIFVFAWNEWSEGGYLEPDEKYGDCYLKAIKEALLESGEFPHSPSEYNEKIFRK